MPKSLDKEITRSVAGSARLAPHMGRLFRGISSLGSQPAVLVRLLRDAGLGPGSRVIDLGCGKGAAALTLAKRLQASVLGIDACGAFIAEAQSAADRQGLTSRARFIVADVRKPLLKRPVDAALMIGLDGAELAAPRLRKLVRPGGFYAFDDLIRSRDNRHADWRGVPTREEIDAALTKSGDQIVGFHRPFPSTLARQHASLIRRLVVNAKALGMAQPHLRPALREFINHHRAAQRLIGGALRPALWVVRRGGR